MEQVIYFLRRTPFLRIFLQFSTGILISNYFGIKLSPDVFYAIVGLLILFIVTIAVVKISAYIGYLISISIIILGFLFHINYNNAFDGIPDGNYRFIATITDVSVSNSGNKKFEASISHLSNDTLNSKVQSKCILFIKDSDKDLNVGAEIVGIGNFTSIKNYGNINEFDYAGYMKTNRIYNTVYVETYQLFDKKQSIIVWAKLMQQKLSSKLYNSILNDKESSVLEALVLGNKENIEQETQGLFVSAGIVHILAVSGLHVGIIYILILGILSLLPKRNKVFKASSLILSILAIWIYALITGLSTSVVRASIMFTIFLTAQFFEKKTHSINNLSVAGFIIILINPNELFMPGFHLSFLAVLGIVVFYPLIKNLYYPQLFLPQKVFDIFYISIAAQILTLPILIRYFNQVSYLSIFSNIIVLPIASIFLYGGLLLLVTFHISPIYNTVAFILKLFFKTFFALIEFITSYTWTYNNHAYISNPTMIGVYIMVFLFILLIYFRKRVFLYLQLSILILILSFNIYHTSKQLKQELFIIHNTPGHSTYSVISGKYQAIYSDKEFINSPDKALFYLKGTSIKYGTYKQLVLSEHYQTLTMREATYKCNLHGSSFYNFNNKNILALNKQLKFNKKPGIEILILTNNSILDDEVLQNINPRQVIFDSSCAKWKVNKWIKLCINNDITYYNVRESGALTVIPNKNL